MRGTALRTVDPQVSRGLVDLVLDGIEGRDFDIGVDDAWRIHTDVEPMPGMRAPAGKVGVSHATSLRISASTPQLRN